MFGIKFRRIPNCHRDASLLLIFALSSWLNRKQSPKSMPKEDVERNSKKTDQNKKRKNESPSTSVPSRDGDVKVKKQCDDDLLMRYEHHLCDLRFFTHAKTFFRMAIEEIARETKRGRDRAEVVGPSGWLPCPLRKTNKRFLSNTIRTVVSHNSRTTTKHAEESKRRYEEITRRKPKFGSRLHSFRKPEERMDKKEKDRE